MCFCRTYFSAPKMFQRWWGTTGRILNFEETRVFAVMHTKRQSNQTCSLNVSFSMPKIMNFAYILLRLKYSPNMNLGNRKKGWRASLHFRRVLVSQLYKCERAAAFASHCSLSHLLLTQESESHSWNALQVLFYCLYSSSSQIPTGLKISMHYFNAHMLQIKGRTDR